jgi:hypothetical protein
MELPPRAGRSSGHARTHLVPSTSQSRTQLLGSATDPPILTEHVEAQFGWMIETYPDAAQWRAQFSRDSGLTMSAALLRLLGSS